MPSAGGPNGDAALLGDAALDSLFDRGGEHTVRRMMALLTIECLDGPVEAVLDGELLETATLEILRASTTELSERRIGWTAHGYHRRRTGFTHRYDCVSMSTPGAPGENHEHDDTEHEHEHKNARQDVIAVDETDTALELVNRLEAHTGDGIRHRAFTSLVFDQDDNVLLAQRAPEKRLWGTYWDGTVASHPVEGQSQEEATRQRLEEELGITPDQYDDLRVTDRFEYKRYFENAGVEHEVCAVLKLTLTDSDLDPNEEEVAGLLWVPYERLAEHPEWYRQLRLCPWFEIAMRRDVQTDAAAQTASELE